MTNVQRILVLAAAATLAAGFPAHAQTAKVQPPAAHKIAPDPNQRENQSAFKKSVADRAFKVAFLKGDVRTVKSILVRNGASKNIVIAVPVFISSNGGPVDFSLGNWYCASGHYTTQWIVDQYIAVFHCDQWAIADDPVTYMDPN